MPKWPACALVTALIGAPWPGFAQWLDAHQHGVARAQLAVERESVSLMLEIPGFNLVGFEHDPNTEAEAEAIDQAATRLAIGEWLRVPQRAECRSERLDVRVRGYDKTSAETTHGHDQHPEADHDHANGHDPAELDSHDHDHDGPHQHAVFAIEAALECARPAALDWIELALFDDWHDQRLLRVDVLSESGARRVELRPGAERVELQ